MRTLIASRDRLTMVRLPAYAPDLNPTEGVWAWMKRGITNIASTASTTPPTWSDSG
jgi:transposase